MSDLAGLERALGAAGIALDERGSPVAASEATPPANSATVEFPAGTTPPAATTPETATEGDERMTLDEFAEALSGQVAPDAGIAQQTVAPQAVDVATPVNMTAREIEMQRQLDDMKAKIAEAEITDKIAEQQGKWDLQWNKGQDYWEKTKPAELASQLQAMAKDRGWSDLELERAMRGADNWLAQQHRKWNDDFNQNEKADPLLQRAAYNAPDLATQLVEQYGLRPETRSALAKYAANPDLMKDVAASIAAHTGAEVQQIRQRDEAVTTAARTQVAQHLQNGITPGAPNVAAGKLPPDFSKVDNRAGAEFFANLLRTGNMGVRP